MKFYVVVLHVLDFIYVLSAGTTKKIACQCENVA
jgi:hypothetical protein